jgi:hypothetical protein
MATPVIVGRDKYRVIGLFHGVNQLPNYHLVQRGMIRWG